MFYADSYQERCKENRTLNKKSIKSVVFMNTL